MALELNTELDTGAVADYWRITHREDDFVNGTTKVVVSLYIDEASRRANKYRVDFKTITFAEGSAPETLSGLYTELKKLPVFKNAVDC